MFSGYVNLKIDSYRNLIRLILYNGQILIVRRKNMSKLPKKILKKDYGEDEIPNETTIKAMEETELFSADSVEEMIEDALKEPD